MSESHLFEWRGLKLSAIPAGKTWVINRAGTGLAGPVLIDGEPWDATQVRLREWLDEHADNL